MTVATELSQPVTGGVGGKGSFAVGKSARGALPVGNKSGLGELEQ